MIQEPIILGQNTRYPLKGMLTLPEGEGPAAMKDCHCMTMRMRRQRNRKASCDTWKNCVNYTERRRMEPR